MRREAPAKIVKTGNINGRRGQESMAKYAKEMTLDGLRLWHWGE